MPAPLSADPEPEPSGSIYNRAFWIAYFANALIVAANSLTFRFAEFVAYLGGTEQISGNIVSAGVIIAVLARFWLGQAIDRFGTRHLWAGSAFLFVIGCLLFFHQNLGWTIYVGRVAFASGLAGVFACSIVHIQNRVPPSRRTEVIGSLGSSGFLGMITGPLVGDQIFRLIPEGPTRFYALFAGAATLGLIYACMVLMLTRDDRHVAPHETPAAWKLMFRYWPGPVVAVAMMMGVGFTVMSVFLTRFATHLGLEAIGTFFVGYAAAAFAFRLATRSWSERIGRHRMVLLGMSGLAGGQFLFLAVSADWHLLFPALCSGFGHALLFPAVVSLGAGAFPKHYRGTGTTLVLGFSELGTVLSAPILGAIIDAYNHVGFRPMFWVTGVSACVVGVYYAVTAARRPDVDHDSSAEPTTIDDGLPLAVPVPVYEEEVVALRTDEERPPMMRSA